MIKSLTFFYYKISNCYRILSSSPNRYTDYENKYHSGKIINGSFDKGSPLPQISRASSLNNLGYRDVDNNIKSPQFTTQLSDNQLLLRNERKLKEQPHSDSKVENNTDLSAQKKWTLSNRGNAINSHIFQPFEPTDQTSQAIQKSVAQDFSPRRDGLSSQTPLFYPTALVKNESNDDYPRKIIDPKGYSVNQSKVTEGEIVSTNPGLVKKLLSSPPHRNDVIKNANFQESVEPDEIAYIREAINPHKHKSNELKLNIIV